MKFDRKIIIVIIILAGFIFGVSLSTLYVQTRISQESCGCTLLIPIFIPTFSSLGLFVGSIVYYMIYPKIEEDKKKWIESIEKMLEILPNNEGEALKMLINNRGEISQSRLSSKLGRVKAFRVIERLERRGVVEKVPYGKTNIIKLSEKFREVLLS